MHFLNIFVHHLDLLGHVEDPKIDSLACELASPSQRERERVLMQSEIMLLAVLHTNAHIHGLL